ncbi:MAG: hypothetical protein IH835_08200 [Proteobacteria bacterium]|nr:hypothetical protein [Pseudomonadota bacterium]
MVAVAVNDLRGGNLVEIDGTVFQVVEHHHHKPGKGGAVVTVKKALPRWLFERVIGEQVDKIGHRSQAVFLAIVFFTPIRSQSGCMAEQLVNRYFVSDYRIRITGQVLANRVCIVHLSVVHQLGNCQRRKHLVHRPKIYRRIQGVFSPCVLVSVAKRRGEKWLAMAGNDDGAGKLIGPCLFVYVSGNLLGQIGR